MTTDEFVELLNDPRFIKGIYDYCDGWCDRCAFTAHCFKFAHGQVIEDELSADPADRKAEAKKVLRSLQYAFNISGESSQRDAAPKGGDLPSSESQAERDEIKERQKRRDEAARAHPLSRAAVEYARGTYYWLYRRGEALQDRIDRARTNGEMPLDAPFPEDIEDALEAIRWHRNRAAALLFGIFSTEDCEEARELLAPMYDGQIKTALIGLDRSLLAWGKVQMFWPEAAEEVMHLTSLAAELRLLMEMAFPNARDFIRPGFDDASAMIM